MINVVSTSDFRKVIPVSAQTDDTSISSCIRQAQEWLIPQILSMKDYRELLEYLENPDRLPNESLETLWRALINPVIYYSAYLFFKQINIIGSNRSLSLSSVSNTAFLYRSLCSQSLIGFYKEAEDLGYCVNYLKSIEFSPFVL